MSLERSAVGGVAGPPGPKGDPGDTGPQGDPGEPGPGGTGSILRNGDGIPSNGTGADGDYWADRLTGDLYERVSGSYVLRFNLKGAPGEAGTPGISGASVGTYLLSGATVAWDSGFTYRIGAASYYLDGTLVTSAEQTVTLDAADATHDRLDVLVLDSSGTATKVTGTAAASPAEPSVDPSTYLRLGLVLVSAAASAAPITATPIYAEGSGGEWSASASAGTVTVGSTSNPRSGTKDIEGTAVVAGTTVTFTAPTAVDLSGQDKLILYVRIKTAWATKKALTLRWLAGTSQRGVTVTVGNGLYGLNTQLTGAYQQVVVPLSAFSVPAAAAITKLELGFVGTGTAVGCYVDDVALQSGAPAQAAAVPYVSCMVHRTTDQNLTSGSGVATAIQFTAEDWDTHGMHDNSTNNTRLTCKIAGRYRVRFRTRWSVGASGQFATAVRKNGVSGAYYLYDSIAWPGDYMYQSDCGTVDLVVGDYLELVMVTTNAFGFSCVAGANLYPQLEVTLEQAA